MRVERDRMEFEGEVIDTNKGKFRVKIREGYIVLCTLSGKIRQSSIKILVEDRVLIEVSPYDTTQGRIVFRLKSQ